MRREIPARLTCRFVFPYDTTNNLKPRKRKAVPWQLLPLSYPWAKSSGMCFRTGRGSVVRRRTSPAVSLPCYEEQGELPWSAAWEWMSLVIVVFAVVGWFAWPLLGFMEPVLEAISEFIAGWPPILVPIVIALVAIVAAAWWIRNFFESRRTPAGFGKMTDDDWFRVIFVAFSGLAIAVLAFVIAGFEVKTVAG